MIVKIISFSFIVLLLASRSSAVLAYNIDPGGLDACKTSCADPDPGNCYNGPNNGDSGNCPYNGAPACGVGTAWTQYSSVCLNACAGQVQSCCTWYWRVAGEVCSTGDKCVNPTDETSTPDTDIKYAGCTCGSVYGTHKYCCSSVNDAPVGCVKYAIQDNYAPWEGVCPGGSYQSDTPCPGSTPPPPPPPGETCTNEATTPSCYRTETRNPPDCTVNKGACGVGFKRTAIKHWQTATTGGVCTINEDSCGQADVCVADCTCGGSCDQPPTGYLDGTRSDCSVFGWATDPDITGPISVKFYTGANQTGTYLGQAAASLYRSDVGNHAFDSVLPNSSQIYDGNTYNVYAYGIDNETGGATVLGTTPKSIACGASVTVVAFDDLNNNGVKDSGEGDPTGGVTLTMTQTGNGTITSSGTGANVTFKGLNAGSTATLGFNNLGGYPKVTCSATGGVGALANNVGSCNFSFSSPGTGTIYVAYTRNLSWLNTFNGDVYSSGSFIDSAPPSVSNGYNYLINTLTGGTGVAGVGYSGGTITVNQQTSESNKISQSGTQPIGWNWQGTNPPLTALSYISKIPTNTASGFKLGLLAGTLVANQSYSWTGGNNISGNYSFDSNGGVATVFVSGALTISGNITTSDITKQGLIIIATGDITIGPTVTTIDAVLISTGGKIIAQNSVATPLAVYGGLYSKSDLSLTQTLSGSSANTTTPSVTVNFQPIYLTVANPALLSSTYQWQELVPVEPANNNAPVTPTPPPFDFSMATQASGGNITINQGKKGQDNMTVSLLQGTAEAVTFSAPNPPAGVTVAFTQNPCTPSCNPDPAVKFDVGSSVPKATYNITVNGLSASGTSHSAVYHLTVN